MDEITYGIGKLRGHEKNRESLRKLFEEKASSGSYLFSGMPAIGKFKTALWFAQLVNCPSFDAPCGLCVSCRKIDKGVHPDVKIIKKLEDKTVITIDQVRDQVVNEANFKPLEGRFRVFIIDDAHLLNDQSQNSLLKVMEEPGAQVIIILVTSRPSDLLDTIRSRCRAIRFFPLSDKDMEYILRDLPDVDYEKLGIVTSISAGSPGKAIKQAQDEVFWKIRHDLFTVLEKLPDGQLGDILKYSESVSIQRADVERLEAFFEMLLSWFRDIEFIQAGLPEDTLLNRDFKESLEKVYFCYSAEDITVLQSLILEIRKLTFENNLNLKMGIQRLLIKIKQTGSVQIG
ncbi:MAG: DNA polymerase III subunit delta' [Firmicutes bacterium]|nr:DNA polymerase III subunit delta' [Bacillota bacterium]